MPTLLAVLTWGGINSTRKCRKQGFMFLCYQLQILFPLDHVGSWFIEWRSVGQIRSPTWSGGGEVQPASQLNGTQLSEKKARDAKVLLIPDKFYLQVLFPVSPDYLFPERELTYAASSCCIRNIYREQKFCMAVGRWSSLKLHYISIECINKSTQTKSLWDGWNYKKNGCRSLSVFSIALILKPTESSRTQKVEKEERRMPGSVHPFTASPSLFCTERVRRKGKGMQHNFWRWLSVARLSLLGWIPEACSVTVASGIFRAEAWGQGSRERDSSRCLVPAGGGRSPARQTAGGRTDGARIRGEGYPPPTAQSRSTFHFGSSAAPTPPRDGTVCSPRGP